MRLKSWLNLLVVLSAPALAAAQTIDIGPAPGRLIDIGGRKLHVNCAGSGSPTVVLEAGASSFAIDWSLVQPEVAKATRVCSYDRAGSGWSDARPDVETPPRVIQDLRTALASAGEKPPYLMIGASRGGLFVRQFHATHPDDVVGMVLVDPSSEDRLFTMFNGQGVTIASLTAEQYRSVQPTGPVPIAPRPPQTGTPFDRLPSPLYETRVAIDRRLIASMPATVPPEVVVEYGEGDRAMQAALSDTRAKQQYPLGTLPLTVLTRGMDTNQGLIETHAALARLSSNARHIVVKDSGHEVHLFQPAVVVQAIRDVMQAARDKKPLPSN
jgi:pimeloyl-ACP methyl ester carboxylesterase